HALRQAPLEQRPARVRLWHRVHLCAGPPEPRRRGAAPEDGVGRATPLLFRRLDVGVFRIGQKGVRGGTLFFKRSEADLEPMRRVIFMIAIWTLGAAARAETALEALRELPRDQVARIARIVARDGTPA